MMGSFVQILRRLPTSDASSSNRGTAPFKVQINFDIPIFEGQIDADVVDKWLNLLEGYFSVHNFLNRENITFALIKVVPHVKNWWETLWSKRKQRKPHCFQSRPPRNHSGMLLRNNTTMSEVMTTCIPNGPHCGKKETKKCPISQISSIPCAPSWVSNILSDIWCSSIVVLCIDTSRPKWNFWTSHPWARPTDMPSKSSRSSNKRRVNLGLGTPHNKSWERAAPTYRTKDREKMDSIRTTSPSHKQRRTLERQRKIPRSGATSIRVPWHNTANYHSKQSLVAEVKSFESYVDFDSELEPKRGRWIIDAEPSATVATTKLQPSEPDEPEEGEHLFHSQMWVKGTPLHFIVDSGSQKNLISAEVIKRLALPTTPHPQPYTIGWLHQGSDLCANQQCRLSYNIKPFKDEVLCDVSPLEVCDVLLGQPYLWKRHVVYESRPRSVIITLNRKLYRILKVVPPSAISLISTKQCRKVISQMGKFVFFVIRSQNK
jgi:hypothetical protein